MKKEKMPEEKKLKLVYSGELLLFVVVFGTLGILFLTGVIKPADWKRYLFTYVTLIGGTWLIIDIIWALASQKRRAKVCMLDKLLVVPVAPVLITFSIICIINNCNEELPYRYVIGADLSYLSLVYLFMAIYHYYKPTPQMLEILEEAKHPAPEEPPVPENEPESDNEKPEETPEENENL